jgi:transcriptional regulator with XRE-family HTH domain
MDAPIDPIWEILEKQGRKFLWLAEKTGFSEGYIREMRVRRRVPSATFRAKCAEILDIPERYLFADVVDVSKSESVA